MDTNQIMNTNPIPKFNRHQFLSQGAMAASAVALPYFIPASALNHATRNSHAFKFAFPEIGYD